MIEGGCFSHCNCSRTAGGRAKKRGSFERPETRAQTAEGGSVLCYHGQIAMDTLNECVSSLV